MQLIEVHAPVLNWYGVPTSPSPSLLWGNQHCTLFTALIEISNFVFSKVPSPDDFPTHTKRSSKRLSLEAQPTAVPLFLLSCLSNFHAFCVLLMAFVITSFKVFCSRFFVACLSNYSSFICFNVTSKGIVFNFSSLRLFWAIFTGTRYLFSTNTTKYSSSCTSSTWL